MGAIPVDKIGSARVCAEKIMKSGPQAVIVTLGKRGAILVNAERAVHIPEFPVTVVDTQGAGDAFLGTFIAKLSEGMPDTQAVEYANLAASLSVTKRGTT